MRPIILTAILFVLLGGAHAAVREDVTVNGDTEYGSCLGSKILTDFFQRYPPETKEFSLEIDIDRATNEIYVYYYDMPDYEDEVTYYDGDTCAFLRTDNMADPEGEVG